MPKKPFSPGDKVETTPTASPQMRRCGTMLGHQHLLMTDLAYMEARNASENFYALAARGGQPMAERSGITTIDVVVHVIYNTAQQNISDAQIKSQIDVLNRDFRRTNADASSVPAAFAPLVADARIQFRLAEKDPTGAATNGITRTQTATASFNQLDEAMKSGAAGGHDPWPSNRYLNIWTVPRLTSPQGDLLGYAQFPGGPAATDGVVIWHSAFGSTGTASTPFNLGRTTTHEVGHWLNLRHIWGDDGNGCNGSDFVADTPNQAGPNYGAPAFPHVTCNNGPNGDMFMNYMDYVDDRAMFMFTAGQVVRMQACLSSDRSSIGTTTLAPTTKWREDVPVTLKFRDDTPPKLKIIDDGIPVPPGSFPGGPGPGPGFSFGAGYSGYGGGVSFAPRIGPPAAPFVLSTPHHSMAWAGMFPQAAQQAIAHAEAQLRQYEQALNLYAQADAAGQLDPASRQQAEAIYQDYLVLTAEYRRLMQS